MGTNGILQTLDCAALNDAQLILIVIRSIKTTVLETIETRSSRQYLESVRDR